MTASITCPKCHMTSHHPKDVKYRYCGNCWQFHDDIEPDPGNGRLEEIYCSRCDVFGHNTGTPYCEFYFDRWESDDYKKRQVDKGDGRERDDRSL